jgi:hypothetical protein
MGVLIDASVLIEHERKRLDLEHHLAHALRKSSSSR